MLKIKLILLTLINTIAISALQIESGPALSSYESENVFSLETTIKQKWSWNNNSTFQVGLRLPIFYSDQEGGFLPAADVVNKSVPSKNSNFQFLQRYQYLALYLDSLAYQSNTFTVGVASRKKSFQINTILAGNVFQDLQYPQYQKTFSIENVNGGLYTSTLVNPSLALAFYEFRPFGNAKSYFLSDLSITPVLWEDILKQKSVQHFGGGVELKTGGYHDKYISVGSMVSVQAFQRDEKKSSVKGYQSIYGLWLSNYFFQTSVAAITQSANNPHAAYLDETYQMRANKSLGSDTSTEHGARFELATNKESIFGLHAITYGYFSDVTRFSFKVYASYEQNKTKFHVGLVRNEIKYSDIAFDLQNDNSTAYFELDFEIVPELISFKASAYYLTVKSSGVRSKVWVYSRF